MQMSSFKIFSDRSLHNIVELFPKGSASKKYPNLKHRLNEYKLLLVALQESMRIYNRGELSELDSLVGENSCQIRATIMCLLSMQEPLAEASLLDELTHRIKVISDEIDLCSQKPSKEEISLDEFLNDKELNLTLSKKELFLVISFILTKVRVLLPPDPSRQIVRNESTITSKIKELGAVGSTFARELVKHLRHILSIISVDFVQDSAKNLLLPKSIFETVSDKYCVEHNKFGHLKCLPCFWYTLILMKYSLEEKLPLVLCVDQMATEKDFEVVRKFSLAFKVENKQFVETSFDDLSDEAPVVTIFGCSCRRSDEFLDLEGSKAEVLERGPVDLVLAYAAAHRQYPDESKDSLVDNSNNHLIDYYEKNAHEWGCSLENSSLFFLVHAYCDRLKNVMKELS